jgi:outer membrane immunogenic protein
MSNKTGGDKEMRMMTRKKLLRGTVITLGIFLTAGAALAQNATSAQRTVVLPPAPIVDVSVMFVAERSKLTFGDSFWMEGGSGELSFPAYKRISLAMNVTGVRNGNLGSNRSFSKVSFVAGPRYTMGLHRSRIFVEGLVGGVHAFDGIFPGASSASSSANSLAMQAGGGYDIDWTKRITFRPIAASYVLTHLPNGASNTQNDFKVAAGIVFRFPTR